ncbi:hypothetical protein ACODT5_16195 [Streptomyces sp. 5.8]|uniref:hypothetical protein n=1 Tax=Streptomyces sp. 5.8 TaxID=3406571 RepID=UPI003BB497F9
MTRPGASLHTQWALQAGAPGFTAVQESVTAYVEAEREGGRVSEHADAAVISLALGGTVHHLLLTSAPETCAATGETVRRLTAVLLGGAR